MPQERPQTVASSRRAELGPLRLSGVSTFEHLTTTEGEAFLAPLEVVAEETPDAGSMMETGVLLAFDHDRSSLVPPN